MDKLLNNEKSRPLPQYKMPKTWGQFWDLRGQYEVILRSFAPALIWYATCPCSWKKNAEVPGSHHMSLEVIWSLLEVLSPLCRVFIPKYTPPQFKQKNSPVALFFSTNTNALGSSSSALFLHFLDFLQNVLKIIRPLRMVRFSQKSLGLFLKDPFNFFKAYFSVLKTLRASGNPQRVTRANYENQG